MDKAELNDEITASEIGKARKKYRWILLTAAMRTLALVGMVGVVYICFFGIGEVKGNDMYPALRDGDLVVYYRNADYINSDAVLYEVEGEVIAGRVQATYGTEISATEDGTLVIDGNIQPIQTRSGIYSNTLVGEEADLPLIVGADELYILGDNRGSARDSRVYGVINKSDVKGKIFTVIRRRAI